jgi:hypothetical protein
MLNVNNFYSHYGQLVSEDEYIELEGKQIYAKNDRLYVLSPDAHQDPFMWLGHSGLFDGVVFRTNSGYMATMALFDSQQDETLKAVNLCNSLIGLAS